MSPLKSPKTGPDPLEMLSRLAGQSDAKSKEKRDKLKAEIAAPLLGIGFVLLTEYLKDLTEKKKAEKKGKKEVGPPEKSVAKTEEPKEEAEEEPEEEAEEEPVKPELAKKSVEVESKSEVVVIGDSIPKGMLTRFKKGKRPDFIGEVGKSTHVILADVRNNREKLNGKKTAIVSCGINDLAGTDNYERIVGNIDKMTRECEKAGIKEIILLTNFPLQADFQRTHIKGRVKELRKLVLRRFHMPRVKVIDIYKHFVDEKGDLKQKYANKGKDRLHPRKAYSDALKYIASQSDLNLEKLIS